MKASASVLNGWNCASKLRFLCFELQLTLNKVHSTPPKIHATDSIAGEWKSHKHTVFFPLPDDWHGVACDCVFICHSMLPLLFSPYSMWTTETNMWYWNRSSIYPFLSPCCKQVYFVPMFTIHFHSLQVRCWVRIVCAIEVILCTVFRSICFFNIIRRSLSPYH